MPANLRPTFIQVEVPKRIGFRLNAEAKREIIDHISKVVGGAQNSVGATAADYNKRFL